MEKITLKSQAGQTAEVTPYAAHLCSWKNAQGQDYLFMSQKAIFQPPKAIRGGVPVCFPQFANFGPLGQHGFARNSKFKVESEDQHSVTLLLAYDGQSQAAFPHPFELRIKVALCDDALRQTMEVKNTGSSDLSFTCALHTYYRVSDIKHVRVEGLGGVKYLDSTDHRAEKVEASSSIHIEHEVDRVYVAAPHSVKIVDSQAGRTVEIVKEGFPDAVLWNPWADKARALADLGDEEYHHMLCLEPAVAASGPVVLAPGKAWAASQNITIHHAKPA